MKTRLGFVWTQLARDWGGPADGYLFTAIQEGWLLTISIDCILGCTLYSREK